MTIDSEGGAFAMAGIDLAAGSYVGLAALDVTSTANASSALTAVKAAITQLATDRAESAAYRATSIGTSGDHLTKNLWGCSRWSAFATGMFARGSLCLRIENTSVAIETRKPKAICGTKKFGRHP